MKAPPGSNDRLIRSLELAHALVRDLELELLEDQSKCPHPPEYRRAPEGRVHWPWCRVCHMVFKPRRGVLVNEQITAQQMVVIDQDGSKLGLKTKQEALVYARTAGLDLVQINPRGDPVICKILDFKKFEREQKAAILSMYWAGRWTLDADGPRGGSGAPPEPPDEPA